ncbi:MAG: rhomboid family intramembrane serine protease [Aphanocapsa sp. GSE-SYN-MK-11-07L]|jgi:membrane associated rhomboid family serine protease|nr:rhomboid family intramembrane serine protease [Aphanocapsa sp. GSE-SYN-MK-11-07L]
MSSKNSELRGMTAELITHAQILGGLVAIMWGLEILNQFFFRNTLESFGIIPRNLIGLRGIIFAPFLHANFAHLMANTLPFLGLGWLVMIRRISDFFTVSLITMLVSGLGVWLFAGANTLTVGASGVIFGYLGYLLTRGWFERKLGSIIFSLIVFLVYGGLVWGVLPQVPGVSWQGHLFGLLGGVLSARLLSKAS